MRHTQALIAVAAIVLQEACATPPSDPSAPITRNQNQADLRTEGWKLLAEVTRTDPASGLPAWRTWRQGNEVLFNQKREFRQTLLLNSPAEFDAMSEAVKPRDIFESTHFNSHADKHIQRILRTEQSDTLLRASRGEVTEFPRTTVIVKAFWRKVEANVEEPVGIWNWSKPETRGVLDSREENWDHQECFSLAPSGHCVIVSDQNFHVVRVDDPRHFSCANCSSPDLRAGDALVLVGMHIAAKTRPDWFWATFWWKGGAWRNQGQSWTCDNAQRIKPIADSPPWNNYSMSITVSSLQPRPGLDANDPCGAPPPISTGHLELLAAFNPFVEARFTDGLHSSCIVCHSRAGTQERGLPPNFVSPADHTNQYPGLRDFEGHIRTDYIWSLKRVLKPTN